MRLSLPSSAGIHHLSHLLNGKNPNCLLKLLINCLFISFLSRNSFPSAPFAIEFFLLVLAKGDFLKGGYPGCVLCSLHQEVILHSCQLDSFVKRFTESLPPTNMLENENQHERDYSATAMPPALSICVKSLLQYQT